MLDIVDELDNAAEAKPGSIVFTCIYRRASLEIRKLREKILTQTKPCLPWLHRWKVTKSEILPSLIEQVDKAGAAPTAGILVKHSEKPCIATLQCQNCGTEKVKRI